MYDVKTVKRVRSIRGSALVHIIPYLRILLGILNLAFYYFN